MRDFSFHPDLFEQRSQAIEALAARDYIWMEHFSSVDLLHDTFGLEVCGIPDEADAHRILSILGREFPEWQHKDMRFHSYERDYGWKVIISKAEPDKKVGWQV